MLDIGGNTGFFSCYLSQFAKDVTVVEYHKKTVQVGAMLARQEKITNISFVNADFTKYEPEKQFSVVLSLSVHAHIPMDTKKYLKKIHGLLRENGILLLESHIREWDRHPKRWRAIEKSKLFTLEESGFIDDNNGRMRKFLLLKKK